MRALALIGFALVGPAALPAGGADARLPELRRRQSSHEPLTAPAATALRCSPQHQAPVIAQATSGQPLRLLRRWCGAGGQRWLQVELPAPIVAATSALPSPRRGWLLEAEL
ncbi:MAG: SH3 domain-containing protein [Cyanobacteriota bacterium]|nr:SH3 domain-containing protein [Cyanobacteriota bacterium]